MLSEQAAWSTSSWVSWLRSVHLGKYWRRSVGVLVGASLPGTLGVTKVDVDTGVDGELGVLGHLFAWIPGQRPPQVFGETLHRFSESSADCFCGVAIG